MAMKNRLREVRRWKRYSAAKLAEAVGVSAPYITAVEKGRKPLNERLLMKICEVLRVTPNDIYGVSGPTVQEEEAPYIIPGALPILGTIRAGEPILAEQHIIGYRVPPPGVHGDFWLLVTGDSEEAEDEEVCLAGLQSPLTEQPILGWLEVQIRNNHGNWESVQTLPDGRSTAIKDWLPPELHPLAPDQHGVAVPVEVLGYINPAE